MTELHNPYWDELKNESTDPYLGGIDQFGISFRDLPAKLSDELAAGIGRRSMRRTDLTVKYSWAITKPSSIEYIAATLKGAQIPGIVEIGAGTGYWAYLLGQLGISVAPYDLDPPGENDENHWHHNQKQWVPVLHGDTSKAGEHPELALMLCWPPYDTPMAADALLAYRGDLLIYIGEGYGGCTANDDFFKLRDEQWDLIGRGPLTFWSAIHDRLEVYRRKTPRALP